MPLLLQQNHESTKLKTIPLAFTPSQQMNPETTIYSIPLPYTRARRPLAVPTFYAAWCQTFGTFESPTTILAFPSL